MNSETLPETQFALIIGLSVSKGARSPSLWNTVFSKYKMSTRMYPMDVAIGALSSVLKKLESNPKFIGGAIAAPYKEAVARWLGNARLTDEAARIGAVNCLFRRKEDGALLGTNTDGEAAIMQLEKNYGSVYGNSVFILGCGGAGKAVSAYLKAAGANIRIFVRDTAKNLNFTTKIGAEIYDWQCLKEQLTEAAIIVNTTDIGSIGSGKADSSPLTKEELSKLAKTAIVFDIVYQPHPTELLKMAKKLNLTTLGGVGMNLDQAVIAFARCMPDIGNIDSIRRIMLSKA